MMPIAAVESDPSKVRIGESAHILVGPSAVVAHPTAKTARMLKSAEVMDKRSLLTKFVTGSTGVRASWRVQPWARSTPTCAPIVAEAIPAP